MIMAEVGLTPKVSGSRMEIPAEGPMPGSAPMIVPATVPRRQYKRFIGVTATEKPIITCCSASIRNSSVDWPVDWKNLFQNTHGQGDTEPASENQVHTE